MKAFTLKKYGTVENLKLEDCAKPQPKTGEVSVKIHTTAVNDYDWAKLSGKPLIYRLMFGLFKPKTPILGMELSGTIESLGEKANKFNIGDAVYGDISEHAFGSFAEYICVSEEALVLKPSEMSFEDAAAISHAANLAYQALHAIAKMQSNQKILINGAGGGVGSFALQIAKDFKASVAGVDSGEKLSMMKELGFYTLINYKKTNFCQMGERYDIILDCKTNKSPFAYLRALKREGIYVTVGGKLTRLLQIVLLSPIISLFSKKRLKILALKANQSLDEVHKLYISGNLKTAIDGPYPFKETPKAVQRFGEGKHFGKVLISLEKS